jgi:hypothetical protein
MRAAGRGWAWPSPDDLLVESLVENLGDSRSNWRSNLGPSKTAWPAQDLATGFVPYFRGGLASRPFRSVKIAAVSGDCPEFS